MEYNSPLTIYNLPLAPTHILVIIKASVLDKQDSFDFKSVVIDTLVI